MYSLEKFGIAPPDTNLSQHTIFSPIGADEFQARAGEMLEDIAPVVQAEVIPALPEYTARLHSTGFIVINLGTHPDLGDLRQHIYPRNQAELREPWGVDTPIDFDANGHPIRDGVIHDHAFCIASINTHADRVANGRRAAYEDRIYRVSQVPGASATDALSVNGLFRRFHAVYHPEGVVLETDGSVMRASPVLDRRVELGDHHFIEPGIWHTPTIEPGRLVGTLIFSSHRMSETGPYILAGGAEERHTTTRRYVAAATLSDLREDLLAAA